jgi:hypothetical protein
MSSSCSQPSPTKDRSSTRSKSISDRSLPCSAMSDPQPREAEHLVVGIMGSGVCPYSPAIAGQGEKARVCRTCILAPAAS